MKDFLDYLIKNIVEHKETVSIEEQKEESQIVLSLQVAQEDMGKVIGKRGRIIKAIRDMLRIKGLKEGKRVFLNLLE